MKKTIKLTVNNDFYEIFVDSTQSLNDVLREELNLTGTKLGCGTGDCGACTVIMNGKTVSSCLTLAFDADGADILTIEGLAPLGDTHPIQDAFIKKGAIQCGFCTPGMELSALYLIRNNPLPTRLEIREALSGNLCRCTGYNKIIDAIEHASIEMAKNNKKLK